MTKIHYRIPLLILLIISMFHFSYAQEMPTSTTRFIQNKGQWSPSFNYRLSLFQGEMRLAKDKFIYILHEPAYIEAEHQHPSHDNVKNESELFDSHAYEVRFLHANSNVKVIEKQKYPDYQNYFLGNNPKKWATNVEIFGELWYEQLYKGIDMNIYGIEEGLKYNFMLQPNANPSQIQLQYEGIENICLKNGNLILKTSFTEVKELAPIAFQIIGGQKIEVPCVYILKNKTVSFSFPKGYDKSYALTIDPTIIFSTYTGSRQDNWGYTATYDKIGNGYAGGVAFDGTIGQSNYPTLGAFQSTYQGNQDITITKFNSTGNALIFSTYLGGGFHEVPISMVTDKNDNLFILGMTASTNFPKSIDAYDTTVNGNADIFITKFSATGQFLASTFIGGNGEDGINSDLLNVTQGIKYNYGDDSKGEIITDNIGNCYIVSSTQSADFPITAGCFDSTLVGFQDGIVAKFNFSLTTLMWSSFIGGDNDDIAYSLNLNKLQNVLYVTGGTRSTNFPVSPSGVVHSSYQGGLTDGFILKLSADGDSLIKGTYIGTSNYDQSYFVRLDKYDNVYVVGQTKGAYPVVGNVYTNVNSRQFISKLDPNLSSIVASTVFGRSNINYPNISFTAFEVDDCQNVYIAGWGGDLWTLNPFSAGTIGMPTTSNAYDSTTNNNDFYIMALSENFNSLLYATFLGADSTEEHSDGGMSRFDKKGVLYLAVCAGCGGTSTFPTTPGAWSATNNSVNCNQALMKMNLNIPFSHSCYTTGIVGGEKITPFSLSPNPAAYTLDIKLLSSLREKTTLSIRNIMGMEITTMELIPNGSDVYTLPIENLANGTYLCVLSTEERQYVQRFVVLK